MNAELRTITNDAGEKVESWFKGEKMHGLSTIWFANGHKNMESEFKNGK